MGNSSYLRKMHYSSLNKVFTLNGYESRMIESSCLTSFNVTCNFRENFIHRYWSNRMPFALLFRKNENQWIHVEVCQRTTNKLYAPNSFDSTFTSHICFNCGPPCTQRRQFYSTFTTFQPPSRTHLNVGQAVSSAYEQPHTDRYSSLDAMDFDYFALCDNHRRHVDCVLWPNVDRVHSHRPRHSLHVSLDRSRTLVGDRHMFVVPSKCHRGFLLPSSFAKLSLESLRCRHYLNLNNYCPCNRCSSLCETKSRKIA